MPPFHDESAEEFAEAAAYYERRLAGLGDRFIHEIVESLSLVDEMPRQGRPGR